jgi:hypothetical protein
LPAVATDLQLIVLATGYALSAQRFQPIPRDPLAIQLSPLGGTLEIAPVDGADPDDPGGQKLGLLLNEVFLDSSLLDRWASMNGATNRDPGRLSVPAMPPGGYSVCWVGLAELLATVDRGRWERPKDSCAEGVLSGGGRLELVRKRPLGEVENGG